VGGDARHGASRDAHVQDTFETRRFIMSTNTPKKNRVDETLADQKLIDGLTKHASTITSLVIGGVAMATKDIIGTLQTRISTSNAALTTRATWQAAVAADKAERQKTKTIVSGVQQALMVAFAGQIDALADFGLTPRKVPVITPAEKTERTAKALATRAARHTLGKVQKSKITGDSPATATPAPAPLPAGPSPAPVAAPAAPVSPAPAVTPPTPAPATAVQVSGSVAVPAPVKP
jgi:hypothetical protein